jgi:hypothetical protein
MTHDCQSAIELLAQDLHGRVAPGDAVWLAEHLQECAACRQAEADQRATEELLRTWPHVPHDPERALVAIRATIARDRAGGAPRQWPRPAFAFAVALVVMAVVLLAVPWRRSPAPPPAAGTASRPTAVATTPPRTARSSRGAVAPAPSLRPPRKPASLATHSASRTARRSEPRSVRQTRQPALPVAPTPDQSGQGAAVAPAELARFFAVAPPPEPEPSGYAVETATGVAADGTPFVVVTVTDLASAALVAQTIERAEPTAAPDPKGLDDDARPLGGVRDDVPPRSGQAGKGGWI